MGARHMKSHALTCMRSFNARLLGAGAAAAIMLAPVYAHAQSAPILTKALPPDGYYANVYPPGAPFHSWLDMVSATQAAQPNWMTPLVPVTPRLEQELRADFYGQQNGTGSQGNGQHIDNYGGPGGFRVEFIPAYNVELIVAAPPYAV